MNRMLKQTLILLILAVMAGTARNLIFPEGIEWVGKWRSLSSSDGPIVPPSAEEGDPPFIAIDVAEMEHTLGKALFVDARDPEEFVCGTIPGSINIPFEQMPEGNLSGYFDSAMGGIAKEQVIIVFCSGEECDLSLHLSRNLQEFNYSNLMIFFGGAREWEKFELELERGGDCVE